MTQTATNPETGETLVLVGDQWAKADRIATNDKGEKAYLVSGKWITSDGQANLPSTEKPQRSLASETGRQFVGLPLRAVIEGVAAPFAMAGNALAGLYNSVTPDGSYKFPDQQAALSNNLTRIGLPAPENAVERVGQDVMGAASGTGALAQLFKLANPTSALGQMFARGFTENLPGQVAAATSAAGAAGTTREYGGGPMAQLTAGLAGGIAGPMTVQAFANAPRNMIAKSIAKSDKTPFAAEGERLSSQTGMDLSLGQRTGNKMVLSMENAARQYAGTADRVQDIDVKLANQAIAKVQSIADDISKNASDPATLGTKIENTVKTAATNLDNLRNQRASVDYGKVREIAGDAPVIKFENFVTELRSMIDEYSNVAGADARKVVAQAQAALKAVTEGAQSGVRNIETPTGKTIKLYGDSVPKSVDATVNEAMKSRSFYGKAARGGVNVFEDIAPDLNRTIGARLFGAINKDFDQSAANANGSLRDALNAANTNFRNASQSIEFLEKSVLGKLVGEELVDAAISGVRISSTPGEAIVQKLMSAHPSSRKTAIEILNIHNPELAKETRAFVLRDALDKAMSIPPSGKGAGQVPLSFNRFVSVLGGNNVKFAKQLESYGFTPREIKDITDIAEAMGRAGDRTGANFSGTNVQGNTMEIVGAMGDAATGNLRGLTSKVLSIGGKVIGLNKIADAMASSEGRQALRTIVSPKASPAAIAAAFTTIDADLAPSK